MIVKILIPLIQETNLERVVLPTPELPTNSKCPIGYLSTLSILAICSITSGNSTKSTSNSSSPNDHNLSLIYTLSSSIVTLWYYPLSIEEYIIGLYSAWLDNDGKYQLEISSTFS